MRSRLWPQRPVRLLLPAACLVLALQCARVGWWGWVVLFAGLGLVGWLLWRD